jgi:hypothetical protein
MHLIESDPVLSKPLTGQPTASEPGASDWFWLIDHTDANPPKFMLPRIKKCEPHIAALYYVGTYRLIWDLSKSDIPA